MSLGAPALIWTPVDTAENARNLAISIVGSGLAACANVIGPIESHFVWKGAMQRSEEYGVLIKLDARTLDAAVAMVEELHVYDVPVVIGWRADSAPPATLAFLAYGLD
ncbi:Divalent-cation tolerance protein CutA [Tsuneonella dongtanensis]|uniref:Divalent-cation tolerance protein CutA n=1 Tax=Tsuneonella dongtanensis TaxID=692370 RepID=A0A1B2AAG9_9SPHN|nr:divalent-cation tolerance protein CutA [Tsuneonella dongtanensis]ANY19045.1 Divalent-cation tolerance protein CutA [Tsuneonella dongtanensis]